jgi:hypothetical protein
MNKVHFATLTLSSLQQWARLTSQTKEYKDAR